jgi:5-methyltetrahydrofolate--homocysteine methyltransferase
MPNMFEFTPADWARTEQNWKAWWAGELERSLVVIDARVPGPDWANYSDFVTRFSPETPVEQVLDYFEPYLAATHPYGDAFPRWWVNAGPGVMAAFFGAEVEFAANTTWFKQLDLNSLTDLHLDFQPDNFWWQRIQSLTQAAVARWGERVVIGHTDLGGTLDILASLRGSQTLLYDLYDSPENLLGLTSTINQLWKRCYLDLYQQVQRANRGATACWGPCWSPGKGYMLQCDFAYMISPKMFEQFVLPDLTDTCAMLDYGFYHLDGKGQIKHLDHLLSIERLRGIQWIPGEGAPPPEEWLPLLRRIRDGGKLCQVYVTPSGALKIKRELGGKGFLFYIWGEEEPDHTPLSPQEAEAFLEAWQAEKE